ncbi:MAG: hypothetical protein IPP77_12850 [Bacteroidetes bacterium]|nr:hypothetical protein [Bacteroidota bacterium]
MKIRTLVVPFLVIFFSGCVSYVQIVDASAKSENLKQEGEQFIYENDTVKVRYTFWEANGVMAFTIENKWGKPIYIDWKKSAFINSNVKLSYFMEKETTNTQSVSVGSSYLYSNIFNWSRWYSLGLGVGTSNSTTIKEERISFIPPHSVSSRTTFKILPGSFIKLNNVPKEILKDHNVKGKVMTATKETSQIFFRNFLTYSTKESFDIESYIDNEFYVSKVTQLPG